ncbi:FISUMP domain-containing protein [Lewinella sp. LCG006]|uniref:FISUMP domain-containing protein n=1 Tax=Lewinella sp. LCG006 TaxID=3231911 RepID=UPI0034602BBD
MSRLLSIIIVVALLQSSCEDVKSGKSNQFVDSRDLRVYEVVTIGAQDWLGADLKFHTPESFCYENEEENCREYGRLYNFQEAKTACPEGWRLPTETDWRTLEQALGMQPTEVEAIRVWRGEEEGTLLAKQLGVKYSGMGKFRGTGFLGKDQFVYYWVDAPGPAGEQFSLYRMLSKRESGIYSDQVPKMDLCCVRCVRGD